MKLVDVQRKDIYVTVEFSLEQWKKLRLLFERMNIEYNSEKEPELVKAVQYLHQELYPHIVHVDDTISEGEGYGTG